MKVRNDEVEIQIPQTYSVIEETSYAETEEDVWNASVKEYKKIEEPASE